MRSIADDIAAIGRMPMVPTLLDVVVRTTGMRFAAVARVTDTSWTTCAVRDDIAFGLKPGDELKLSTTICDEIRQHGQAVVFGSASADPHWREHATTRLYGIESYVSIPILRADGSFFGTLCAIDPLPAKLDDPDLLHTLTLFAQLIAAQLHAQDLDEARVRALDDAARVNRQLVRESQRTAALMAEREVADAVIKRELKDTRRLREVAAQTAADGGTALFGDILDAAIEIVGADAGTVQLLDPATQTLGYLVSRSFKDDILAHFASVDAASGSPCGVALASGQRAVVVFDDPAVPDPDGANRWHLDAGVRWAQSTPLVSRSGQPLGMLSTHWGQRRELDEREIRFLDLLGRHAADLIERNQVQQALQVSERELREEARRKDEFIAVLAHELRNPLAPIRSGVELLRMAARDPRVVEQVRPVMERQVSHMVRLIDDLLDVSRISSGKLQLRREPVTLQSIVDSAVDANRNAIAAAGIELQVELDDASRVLDVDPTRLSQVLSNVLHNAAKFTPAGGRITLRATSEPGAQVIGIADTGAGIPAGQLSSIFELFTQVRPDSAARHGGMGIGLALARQLMALHGGSIEARSDGPGRGSEFTIRLPVATQAVPHGDAAPAPAGVDLAGARVLVVDDNQDAADSVAMLLSLAGAEARVAYDAHGIQQAVRDFGPALVLLDLGMPGVDGYEACRLIREDGGAAVFVAALTGWGQDEDRRRATAAGFDAHLVKPVTFPQLVELAVQAQR